MPLANGEMFAGFQILRPLGFGGMGEVYLVLHPRLPRQEALKILPAGLSADPEFRVRFNREAELVATLYNPHIVGVHDRGEWAGQLWISMDYIDGPDAGRLLREQYPAGIPAIEVVDIVVAVADALDYAHARGLLHRDVKPPNILLTQPERGRRRVLLADFGIARDSAEVSGITETNVTLGTVNYAAPEQLTGSAIDGRADQYGLAATAYHLLTGAPMFGTSNPAVVIGRHLSAPPPRLADSRPELAALDPVLGRALAKDPAARFATCSEFADAMRRALVNRPAPPRVAPPPAAPSVPPAVQPPPTSVLPRYADGVVDEVSAVSEPRWPWLLAGVAVLAILAGLVIAVWPDRRESPGAAAPSQRTSATAPAMTPTTLTGVTTTTATTTTTGAVSFDQMRDLVAGFYALLPGGAAGAWSQLDSHYQQRNGFEDYLGFWSGVESVSVLSIGPRTPDSVVARLRYVLRDGRTDTEDRWLSIVESGGRLLIYDSDRIGPA